MSMTEFIDLCILLGCDYTKSIKGMGLVKAFKYMKDKRSIEKVLEQVTQENKKKEKFIIPEDFEYQKARDMFVNPNISTEFELKWNTPDDEGLVKFLVDEKGFNKENVENAIAKLKKSKLKSNQSRLDLFFKKK